MPFNLLTIVIVIKFMLYSYRYRYVCKYVTKSEMHNQI